MSGDEWRLIKASLEARGLWDADGISRKARARLCKACGAPVLAGLDHEPLGLATLVDPVPLNALGEALALMTDRRSYALWWSGKHYALSPRGAIQITASPAGTDRRYDVVAEHKCGMPLDQTMREGSTLKGGKQQTAELSDEPPF